MRKNTLRKLAACLREMRPEIVVPADVDARARRSVERMLEISR